MTAFHVHEASKTARQFGLSILATAIALVASSARADPPKPVPDIVVQGSRPEDKVVCRVEVTTGSILSRRTCKTQRQIDRERETSLAAAEQLRQQRENEREIDLLCEVQRCRRGN
jgi:hypothetical protein